VELVTPTRAAACARWHRAAGAARGRPATELAAGLVLVSVFKATNYTVTTHMFSPEVQNPAERSVLCWLATVDGNGQPNASPKEIFAIFDAEHLVIANIASPTSVRNIEINPLVCVSFIDVFVQKGFKVAGTARNVPRQDAEFSRWAAPLNAKAGPRFPIHSVLVVRATAIDAILAPSYRLYAGETTEQSQMASAMRAYGVQPAGGDA